MPKRQDCLADLFKVLEDNKTALNIRHYSIQQPTLEQVGALQESEAHRAVLGGRRGF